ncbi:MAG: N-acetylneuraminic acid mutarotase [Sphingobacteriales bacterium]|jgi:N-acetylneuraminic acid mutarotase
MKSVKILLLTFIFFVVTNVVAQDNLAIGTSTPSATAILDLVSDSLGFLPTKLTTAERDLITNPANGLFIYNKDSKCINVFDNLKGWQSLCGCNAQAGTISLTENWLCIGGSSEITLTGSRGIVEWQSSTDGSNFSTIPKENDTYLRIKNLGDTTFYRAILTDGNCDPDTSEVVKIDVEFVPPLAPLTIYGPDSFCTDQIGYLSVDNDPSIGTYIWTVSSGTTVLSGHGTDSIKVHYGVDDASVCIQTKNACLSTTTCQTFRHLNVKTPTQISGIFSFCEDMDSVVYKVTPVKDAISYEWKIENVKDYEYFDNAGDSVFLNLFSSGSGSICVRGINCNDTTEWFCQEIIARDYWTRKADFPSASKDGTFNFVINDIIYVGGGKPTAVNNTSFVDFYAYDPSTDIWTKKADVPYGVSWASSFAVGGLGYVVCGANPVSQSALNLVSEYNPTNDTWTQKTPFVEGLARFKTIDFVINDTAYIGFGDNPNGAMDDVYRYNQASDTWTQRASGPVITYGGHGTNHEGYGYSVNVENGNNLAVYNHQTDSWTIPSSYPGPSTEGMVSFSVGGYYYVLGGYPKTNRLDQYDSATNSWKPMKAAPIQMSDAVARRIGNKVYIGVGDSKYWYEYCPERKY